MPDKPQHTERIYHLRADVQGSVVRRQVRLNSLAGHCFQQLKRRLPHAAAVGETQRREGLGHAT